MAGENLATWPREPNNIVPGERAVNQNDSPNTRLTQQLWHVADIGIPGGRSEGYGISGPTNSNRAHGLLRTQRVIRKANTVSHGLLLVPTLKLIDSIDDLHSSCSFSTPSKKEFIVTK